MTYREPLYQITPRGHAYIKTAQHIIEGYWDRGKYGPAQPRYRAGVLETLNTLGPLTQIETVKHISEGLIDREREVQWPLRAIRLREAIFRQFDWLLARRYIEEVQ